MRFVVHSRDLRRTTQNSGISTTGHDGTKYYGLLEDILELGYLGHCKVVLFRCKWFKTNNNKLCVTKNNITSISTQTEWFKNDQYILATQADQVFYLDEPSKAGQRVQSNRHWKVVQEVNHRKIWDRDIITENIEPDLIHGSTSSDLSLSADLDNLTYDGLRRDADATEVDVSLVHVDVDDGTYEETDDDEDNDAYNTIDVIDDSDDDLLESNNECGVETYFTDESE